MYSWIRSMGSLSRGMLALHGYVPVITHKRAEPEQPASKAPASPVRHGRQPRKANEYRACA